MSRADAPVPFALVPPTTARWIPWTVGLVMAVALLPYAQTLGFGLTQYDDPWLIAGNTLLREPTIPGLCSVLFDLSPATRLSLGAEFLPVRDLSVMLDFALFGSWYAGHHLTNVLLYALFCGLCTLLVARIGLRPETVLAAGLLFALHPLHAESVAWLAERKGLLAGVFVVGTTLGFLRYIHQPTAARLGLCALLLVAAIFSKAVSLGVLGLLLVLLRVAPSESPGDPGTSEGTQPRGRTACRGSGRACIGGWLLLCGVGLAAFVPVFHVGRVLVIEARADQGLMEVLGLLGRIAGHYLRVLLLGGPLGTGYALPDGAAGLIQGAAGIMGLAGLGALLIRGLYRPGPRSAASLGAALMLVFFLPVSQVLAPLQNQVADRYMLLPSLGFCLLVALALERLHVPWLRRGLLVGVLAGSGVMSTLQAATWADPLALNQQALLAYPGNALAMVDLARLSAEAGRPDEAGRWLARARATKAAAEPTMGARIRLHEGLLLLRTGHLKEAERRFLEAIRLDENADRARANLASLLIAQGRKGEALAQARWAARIRPLRAHNQRVLGLAALAADELALAEAAFRKALTLEPGRVETLYNLALVHLRRGQQAKARVLLEKALVSQPGHAASRELLKALGPPESAAPPRRISE